MENQINPTYRTLSHVPPKWPVDGVKWKYVYKHSTPKAIEDPPAKAVYYSPKLNIDYEIYTKEKISKQLFRPYGDSWLTVPLKHKGTKNAFNYDDKRNLKTFFIGKKEAQILNELNTKRPIGNSPDADYKEKLNFEKFNNEEFISPIQRPKTRRFQINTFPYQSYRRDNNRFDEYPKSTGSAYDVQYFNTDLESLDTKSISFAPPSNSTSKQNFTVFEDRERTVTLTPEMSVDKMDEFSGYFYERPKIPFEF
uniref:Uncharacterized protein n=1 Tax=Glossina pallidipes TaxID=7398 RepID=A0A1A9ZS10_GLOPL